MKKIISTLVFGFITAVTFGQTAVQIDSEIDGDLYVADKKSKQLAIIVAGSGPTDKNGNNPAGVKANAYKLLAEGLQEQGINTFTYNKRMFAQMKKQAIKEENMRFDDNVDDLNLVINHFKKEYPQVVLIGHSEGALVATLASQNNTVVTKLISLQGPGESIDKTLYTQLTTQAPFLAKPVEELHNKLKKGELVTDVNPMLMSVYRPSVQPYLSSWMQYDPAVEIKKVTQPVLILQGDKDLQVDTKQGEQLKQAMPSAAFITLNGMNHVLKKVIKEEENLALYGKPEVPLHEELIPTITNFIK